jgi:hypothetical protein
LNQPVALVAGNVSHVTCFPVAFTSLEDRRFIVLFVGYFSRQHAPKAGAGVMVRAEVAAGCDGKFRDRHFVLAVKFRQIPADYLLSEELPRNSFQVDGRLLGQRISGEEKERSSHYRRSYGTKNHAVSFFETNVHFAAQALIGSAKEPIRT